VNHVPALIQNSAHKVWAHQPPAIGNHSKRVSELERRHGDALPKRNICKFDWLPCRRRAHQARLLSIKINPRRGTKSETAKRSSKMLRSKPSAEFRRADVTRHLKDMVKVDVLVSMMVVNDPPPDSISAILAVEGLLPHSEVGFENSGGKNTFECRSGLIDVGGRAITPKVTGCTPVVIGVEARALRECKNFTCVRIKHDSHARQCSGRNNLAIQRLFGGKLKG
jgi:hypothetical protein